MFHFPFQNRIKRFGKRLYAAGRMLLGYSQYDIATYDNRNDNHFANARENPPIIDNTYDARKRVRTKAMYEAKNNCYLEGLIDTLATDLIGYVMPSLQVLTSDPKLNSFIEQEWKTWCEFEAVNLAEKLKIMERTCRTQGEAFVMSVTDPYTEEKTGYSINVVIIPPARVTDQTLTNFNPVEEREWADSEGVIHKMTVINDDGVIVDASTGRLVEVKLIPTIDEVYGYTLIRSNPVTVSARYIKQWFRPKWPGMFRGISEIGPALGLYAQLRRIDIATLTSAEIAAMISGVMKTTNPANDEPPVIQPGTELGLVPGSLVATPDGWEPVPFPANQPVATYEMFVNIILRQIGRLLNLPFGIVAGDHSKYNYSSARLDVTDYDERKKYDHSQLQIKVLNPIYEQWLFELVKMRPDVATIFENEGIKHKWNFTNRPSIDPQKDASVDDMRLKNNTTTLAEVYSNRGLDWEQSVEQIKKERIKINEILGNNLTKVPQSDNINNEDSNINRVQDETANV